MLVCISLSITSPILWLPNNVLVLLFFIVVTLFDVLVDLTEVDIILVVFICLLLELLNQLNSQPRSSPKTHLVDFRS